jgi:hypothetical protein
MVRGDARITLEAASVLFFPDALVITPSSLHYIIAERSASVGALCPKEPHELSRVSSWGPVKRREANDQVDFARNHSIFVGDFDGLGIAHPAYDAGQSSECNKPYPSRREKILQKRKELL